MIKMHHPLLFIFAALFVLPGFVAVESAGIKIPKKVNAVIQDKCYGCHSSEGKNQRAKDKLNWDELNNLSQEDKLKKMGDIQKVLQEGAMPPGRFLEKFPEKKLTDKETAAMQKWASKTLKKLER